MRHPTIAQSCPLPAALVPVVDEAYATMLDRARGKFEPLVYPPRVQRADVPSDFDAYTYRDVRSGLEHTCLVKRYRWNVEIAAEDILIQVHYALDLQLMIDGMERVRRWLTRAIDEGIGSASQNGAPGVADYPGDTLLEAVVPVELDIFEPFWRNGNLTTILRASFAGVYPR